MVILGAQLTIEISRGPKSTSFKIVESVFGLIGAIPVVISNVYEIVIQHPVVIDVESTLVYMELCG